MKGRKPTADEQRHLDRVGKMPCIVCELFYDVETPATIHHCDGKTKPEAHFKVLPLCGPHHQIASPTGEWATRHAPGRRAGKAAFEDAYGSEESLIKTTREKLL